MSQAHSNLESTRGALAEAPLCPPASTPQRRAVPTVVWALANALLIALGLCYASMVQMEDMRRKGQQRVFGPPGPTILPEWFLGVPPTLLLFQLIVAIAGIAQFSRRHWWWAALALFFSHIAFLFTAASLP